MGVSRSGDRNFNRCRDELRSSRSRPSRTASVSRARRRQGGRRWRGRKRHRRSRVRTPAHGGHRPASRSPPRCAPRGSAWRSPWSTPRPRRRCQPASIRRVRSHHAQLRRTRRRRPRDRSCCAGPNRGSRRRVIQALMKLH